MPGAVHPTTSQVHSPCLSKKLQIAILILSICIIFGILIALFLFMTFRRCETGYEGDDCNICAVGYDMDTEGACIRKECNYHGTQNMEDDGTCICKARFLGDMCNQCIKGYNGTTCEDCSQGYYRNNQDTCSVGQCNLAGTSVRETNGVCKCKEAYEGNKCSLCVNGHYKDKQGACLQGECDFVGVFEQAPDGKCICINAYTGNRCELCKNNHFRNLKNECIFGACSEDGTEVQANNGTCICKIGFIGEKCDECQVNYFGSKCNQCIGGFFRTEQNECKECDCMTETTIEGTSCDPTNGNCQCIEKFAGRRCDQCKEGYQGATCSNCIEGYYLNNGSICSLGDCDSQGTAQRETNGKCTCRVNFAPPLCDKCKPGSMGENCEFCLAGYFASANGSCQPCGCNPFGTNFVNSCETVGGQCQCKEAFSGRQCYNCTGSNIGEQCDQCPDDHFRDSASGYCLEGTCSKIGTSQRSDNGTCICKVQFIGDRCYQCDSGYTGEFCDRCNEGYFTNEGDECHVCGCNPDGSNSTSCDAKGQCQCIKNFGGRDCWQCKEGAGGFACADCKWGYHKDYSGVCQIGTCDHANTDRRLGDGTCTCLPGFSGARCKECDVGHFGDDCDNCDLGYHKDSSLNICIEGGCDPNGTYERTDDGICQCMTGHGGTNCNVCLTGYKGASCDTCDKGYYMEGDSCREGSCAPYGTETEIDGSCQCKVGFTGALCDRCHKSYHMVDNVCFEGECNPDGTMKVETNGRCTCHAAYAGARCISCNVGYQGDLCNICDLDYYKVDSDICLLGDCSSIGTAERANDGTCLCKDGYISAQCDNCDIDHHMNTDDGTCLQGACHISGTNIRFENGTCQCNMQYGGMGCHDCNIGYEGPNCDKCHSDYYKSNDICIKGQCDSYGTSSRGSDGTCICKLGFSNALCDACDTGHLGKNCDKCDHGFSMYKGLCKGHKFLLTTGGPSHRGQITYVIDVTNNEWECRLKDFPTRVELVEGGLIDGTTPLICGGQDENDNFRQCWYYLQDEWKVGKTLAHGRKHMGKGSIIYDNKLLISGGEQWVNGGDEFCIAIWNTIICMDGGPINYINQKYTKTQELVGLDTRKVVDHLTFDTYLSGHCNIQIDSQKILVTGGRPEWSQYIDTLTIHDRTFVKDLTSGKTENGPKLYDPRMDHACTKITLGNGKEVALVAGGTLGDSQLTTVEFLPLEEIGEANYWSKGIELPYATKGGAAILHSYDGKATYLLGGTVGDFAAELKCATANDAASCQFIPMPDVTVPTRRGLVADGFIMAVPESTFEDVC